MDPKERPRSPPPLLRDRISSTPSIEIRRPVTRERSGSDRDLSREHSSPRRDVHSPRNDQKLDQKDKRKDKKDKEGKEKDKAEASPIKDIEIDDKRSRRLSGAVGKESRDEFAMMTSTRSPGPKSNKKLDLLRGMRERSNSLPMMQASPLMEENKEEESKKIPRRASKHMLPPSTPPRELSRGSITANDDNSEEKSDRSDSNSGSLSNTPATTASTTPSSPAPGSLLVHRSPRPDGKVVVSSGHVDELIQQLATDQMPDKEYLEQFLLSHPYFLDSVELLLKLLDRFFDPEQSGGGPPSPSPTNSPTRLSPANASPNRLSTNMGKQSRVFIQLRVVAALKKWIELNIDDWDRPELQKQFTHGIERMRGEGGHADQWANHLTDALKRARENRSKPPEADTAKRPKPVLPKNLGARAVTIMDINPAELSRQITLFEEQLLTRRPAEHDMFRKIPINNFYHKSWTSNSVDGAPINALIKRFNHVSYWVSTEIVTLASHKQRSAMIGHFIEMAHAFADLSNFNGLMEMLSGLNMTPVQRLKLAWAGVEPRLMKMLDSMNKLMDPISNWQVYRQTLKDTNPPVLPFMGLFLTDLTFIEENVSRLPNGFVNFEKMSLLGRIYCELRRCQMVPYNLEPIPLIQEFVAKARVLEEDALYENSKKCEPSLSASQAE